MKEKNKLVEFIKTHKKAVITAIAVVAGGVALAITRRNAQLEGLGGLPIPDMEIGEIYMLWRERLNWKSRETCVNAIVDKLTAADLGRFGEELTKINGIKSTNPVQLVVTILEK